MGIFYILTVLGMILAFILVKKSEEKINLVNWFILSLIAYLAFNIAICMIFGVLNVTTNLLFLSIVNLIVCLGFIFKIFKDKEIQKFEIRKRDFLSILIVIFIVCYIAIDQYKPLAKTMANASVDASMHYSAATNFADNMKILAKIDNQTGYNFKTMQTGAYINTGIFINVVRNILPEFKDYVSMKIFEMGILALNIMAFYMLISNTLKTKRNYLIGIIFLILYAFAYPYTSLLYGFSYLSMAIAFSTGLFYLAKIYNEKEVSFLYVLGLIVLMGIGIIFSYCLFVPALFSFICIYVFIKDLKKEEKTYLKFFKKSTLLVTGLLLIVTILAILYLVVPTFTDSDQNKLTDAIGFVGGSYKSLYQDFLFYIPFVILFIYKSLKNNEVNYQNIALILLGAQTFICLVGLIVGIVSSYYYYKIYYIIWILVVSIAVEVMCTSYENKELLVLLKTYLIVWVCIILFAISGYEMKLIAKAPTIMDGPKSPSLAGIYYDTNIAQTANINVSCIIDQNRVALSEELGKIEDASLKNVLVGGMNTNCKAWVYVISRIPSGGESINDLQKAVVETDVEDFLKDENKKYFVLFTGDKYETTEDYELIIQNQAGVILRKIEK